MEEPTPVPQPVKLMPTPYHTALVAFLRASDPEVWRWLAEQRTSPAHAEEARFELLKSTYRVDPASQPAIYQLAGEVARTLGIAAPITIYQAQNATGQNAALVYLPGEVHLVFQGPIAAQLAAMELRALLAHELAHYLLLSDWDGEMLVADEMLRALVHDAHAHPAHEASSRLFRLFTEIFCDRAALAVTGDLLAVVAMLVKVSTGVTEIDPSAYLRQADEVFAHGDVRAAEETHPETFIRARALRLHAEMDPQADAIIAGMIRGRASLDELDLLEQVEVGGFTRRLVDLVLCRPWMQTELLLAHARLFFEDYSPPAAELTDDALATEIRIEPESLRDYYCFVLLDFITADRDLDEPALAAALAVAEPLGLKPRLMELLRQELKLRKNLLDKVDKDQRKILAEADKSNQRRA